MNTTLTGLGLALVLALLAALIGPWFVNWTAYKDAFAREASVLIGVPVTVSGAMDVRLLPTPYVRMRGLSAGSGRTTISADEVEAELAIAPLLRGELKAERAKLVRPRISLAVAADGTVTTAVQGGRKPARMDSVSLDRLEIVDGSVTVTAPAGRYVVDGVSGMAEARSLDGPFRFEGEAGPAGARVQTRLSTSRLNKGAMRLKLALQRSGRAETLDLDGGLELAAVPVFDGKLTVARPAAKEASDREPWRAAAAVRADPTVVQLSGIDFVYGPDDRALRLGGRADARLGERPRLDLALETRQIDFDRFLGDARPKAPAAIVRTLLEAFGGALWPKIDGAAAIDAKSVVLAGDVIQNLRLDLASERGGWRVRKASAVFPGGASLSGTGALAFSGSDPGFAGEADLSVADLSGLRRWLSGGQEIGGPVRSVSAKGRVRAGLAAVSLDDATLIADGARSTGRVSWRAGEAGARDRVEAALVSEALDLDALGIDRVLKSAVARSGFDLFLALDAKSLTLSGLRMAGVSIDGAWDAAGLDLRRFDVRDAAGAVLSGAGKISGGLDRPRGHVSFDLETRSPASFAALARAAGAPQGLVDALEQRAGALTPVDVKIDLDAGDTGESASVTGAAAGGRLDARISTTELSVDAPATIDVSLSSPDGQRLAALAGLRLSPAVAANGGEVRLKASGAISKGMTGQARLAALGLDLTGEGAVALAPEAGLSSEARWRLKSDDLTEFGEAIGRLSPGASPKTPADLSAKVSLRPDGARIEELAGQAGGLSVEGELEVPYEVSRPFAGRLAFDRLPVGALVALALPRQEGATSDRSIWNAAPFGPAALRGLQGRIETSVAELALGGEAASDARFGLVFRPSGIGVENFTARLDGGRLSGAASVSRSGDDVTASVALNVEGMALRRVAALAGNDPPLSGVADLKFDAQGTGRSPSALIGAMTGAGALTLRDAKLRRLDPAAIDRIEPLVESGLALEAPRVAEALDREFSARDLEFAAVVAPFTVSAGVARSGTLSAENATTRLGGGASIDLRRLLLDADLTLQPKRPDAAQVGVSFEGPLASPRRRIDATAFTGWLSVRAVERETKRIEAMEADIKERARLARLRAEEERAKAEEEKRRQDEERRKADAERRKREAEIRALTDALPKAAPSTAPTLPSTIDISPLAPEAAPRLAPPAGVFAPKGRTNAPRGEPPGPPQSILPPAIGHQ